MEKRNVSGYENDIGILELFGKETLENLQKTIAKVTGLGVITSDYKGEPLTEMTAFTPFCQCVRKKGEQIKLCKLSDALGITQSAVTQKYCIYCCPCGLLEVAIPIVIQGRFLGGFLAGQVRCHDIPDEVPRFSSFIQGADFKERAECKKLYEDISVYEYKKFADIAELIFLMVNLLGEKEMARFQNYKKEKDELVAKIKEIEYEKSILERELVHLKAKFNPFFLLTMLTNIANLSIVEDAPRTNEMTIAFADYLKDSIYQKSDTVFLVAELESVERYLKMVSIKYEDKFKYSIKIKKEMEMQKIPSQVLLPYVEKSVFYLTENRLDELKIEICAWYQNDFLCISIKNFGKGIHPENEEMNYSSYQDLAGINLFQASVENAVQRMKVLFEDKFDVIEHDYNNGELETVIKFPMYFRERIV